MKILILAGGQGTRLWPLSRKIKPKQFQKLFSSKTLLQESIERLLPVFPLKSLFISTNEEYVKEVKFEISNLPPKNIIAEPERRERVAAISLFLTRLKKKEFNQPFVVLPSDHLIKENEKFQKAILAGEKFVAENPQYILTFGAKPIFPDTGLGYIKRGKPAFSEINNFKIYKVAFFKEKPNLKRAQSYLKNKNYLWNMGIFIFTPGLMEKAIKDFVPDTYKRYERIREARGKPNFKSVLKKEYGEMDSVSFDYSIIENYSKIAVLPLDVGWSDVGSWTVLKNCLSSPNKNFIKGNYLGIDSKNVLVYGSTNKQLVAVLGVRDLIVAVTDDIILICNKDESQKVKKLVEKLEKNKKFDYL
ncbi:NTP transferase domain-containing protein [Patescibacteria group bacterium]|nr:NTP transferase domain-containing protein [Patescibacteria group bacterium]